MPKLGVNIDHVATLRQARREHDPDPIKAALICQKAGANSIVAHLREDRRHINDADVQALRKSIKIPLNLEMSMNAGIVTIAQRVCPAQATLVPEKREEITTEGGLDVIGQFKRVQDVTHALQKKNIAVSLFIDPIKKHIDYTHKAGVRIIELHTGAYDRARNTASIQRHLDKLTDMTAYAQSLGMEVNAGHGLKYSNTRPIARIKGIHELNIGHSIMAEAIFIGLEAAVKKMKKLVTGLT